MIFFPAVLEFNVSHPTQTALLPDRCRQGPNPDWHQTGGWARD
jgi:hypothetical protein